MTQKDFSKNNVRVKVSNSPRDISLGPATTKPNQTKVFFKGGVGVGHTQSFEFGPSYGGKIDAVVRPCQQMIEILEEQAQVARSTIAFYCEGGLRNLFRFCEFWAEAFLNREMTLVDITPSFIENLIRYLKEENNFITARNYYISAKSVLYRMVKLGWINGENLFPKNPFPHKRRNTKGVNPLSSAERKRTTHALKEELTSIFAGEGLLKGRELSICALAISMRSGINTQPLLSLPPDCIHPHPLKPNRKLLVSFKTRSNKWHMQPLRNHKDIELLRPVLPDVAAIIALIKERNKELREQKPEYKNYLFIYRSEDINPERTDLITLLTPPMFGMNTRRWVKKVGLVNDDGKPLSLNTTILRKTFINRMFELSKEDPVVTAQLAGHESFQTTETHYLRPPADAEKNFSLLGEIRTQELLDTKAIDSSIENTPVAKCKDPLSGRTGRGTEYCTDFLSCIRCKSLVVTPEDLHRLYSFYWVVVRERETVGTVKWKKHYGHIMRIIDKEIAAALGEDIVNEAREHAKLNPHPFWKDGKEYLDGVLI